MDQSVLGMVTDIQRFSLNDGPGIRTTVFFKGCSMRCPWCHNPETISPARELHYYEKHCIGCGRCVTACPAGAHAMTDTGHAFDRSVCVACGRCAEVCFPGALRMSGQKMSVDAVMSEIEQDREYYSRSGGGVTLSGGEVLSQPDFASELAGACHDGGIEIAVETNLWAPFGEIAPFIRKLDLVMADIKLMDPEEHKRWTGRENRLILDNIEEIGRLDIPLIIRTPLIPGVTDTDENLQAIAAFVSGVHGVLYYELLNYNPLGESKFKSLGRKNSFEAARPLDRARLDEITMLLDPYGIPVRIG